jgi:heavy metal sensor kinase
MSLRSLNVRFTALFSGTFILGSLLLSLTTYFFLAGSLQRDEYAEIRSRLLEFWAIYQTGKIELVRKELTVERLITEQRLFMLRIAGRGNNTLFIYLPGHWTGYNLDRLERLPYIREGELIRLPSSEDKSALEIASLELPDGNILQIGINTSRRLEVLQRYRRTFLLVFLPLSAFSLLAGFLFSSRSLQPIRHLIQITRNIINTGRMKDRIPARGTGDELDELGSLFNQMLAKIDSLIQAMRDSLDNVAHDLRTPVTRLRATAELALQSPNDLRSYREALAACIEESGRIQNMLSVLMDISEAETGVMRLNKQPTDLSSVVADMVELYSYAAEEKSISIEQDLAGDIKVSVDLNRLRQVITNLLDNAVKYTPAGGRVAVTTHREGGQALITIQDTGVGIPEAELDHIWDRLFRGDRSRSQPGLGLGLGLVRAVVKAHGGGIEVHSEPGKGSCFTVHLPV